MDLLSSLKALDKKLLNKTLKESGMDSIEELRDGIIDEFETCLDMSKDDQFTRLYFERLLNHENSDWMSAYGQDIEDFLVFVYENGNHNSYYIPTEIKEIIYKLLGSMTQEESPFDVAMRTKQFINTIYRDKEDVLFVVSHGITIKTIVMNYFHYSPEWYSRELTPENCSIRLIDSDNGMNTESYI